MLKLIMHGDKDINWGTPKKIQQLKSRDDNRWHSKKDKQCRFNKGEHQYTELEIEYFFNKPWKKIWRCKCGKKDWKKIEYIDKPSWLH